ncbi:acylphosphatase [uncultured Anaerovibrio sp.]|uniref:acylphosphatase n=1 Tax=uncultured Anaerovibrio sp. TaxID=361586 RepID=UPI00261DA8C3|nr:acylphosphatase [uncultured Anaerovibrio sp.]
MGELVYHNGKLIGRCLIILVLVMGLMAGISLSHGAVHAQPLTYSSSTGQVEEVRAVVSGDSHIPDGVCQRMEKSVQAIGAQLLEGKEIHGVLARKTYYEGIIQQVFDKVLVGYTVKSVTLVPGEQLEVLVELLGWNDRIDTITVETRVVGMPQVVEGLLLADIAGLDELFRDMLQDLPVAAVDWTNGVMKHRVKEFMAERAPEFRADFDVTVGDHTKVTVEVYPLLPVVRTIDLSMRSDTLPNAALLMERQTMQDGADMFVGVPVAFVERHRASIEDLLRRRIDDLAEAKFWGVHTAVTIKPSERMEVMSRSDSRNVLVRFEGRGDLGRRSNGRDDGEVMFRGLFAKQFTSRDGVFALVDFYPKSTRWYFDLGLYRDILPKVRTHVRYSLTDKYWKAGLGYDFAKRLTLLYEYRDEDHINEFALRYKLHDFLAMEAVVDNNDRWLRFIGYF